MILTRFNGTNHLSNYNSSISHSFQFFYYCYWLPFDKFNNKPYLHVFKHLLLFCISYIVNVKWWGLTHKKQWLHYCILKHVNYTPSTIWPEYVIHFEFVYMINRICTAYLSNKFIQRYSPERLTDYVKSCILVVCCD